MPTREQNIEIVERGSIEVYEKGNLDVIDEVVSEDFVLHDPLTPEEIHGRDGLKDYVEANRDAFPDLNITIEQLVAEDDLVAVHFTFRGTHEGRIPDLDLEPTGAEIEIIGMEFDRIEDGKLVETRLLYDTLGFMQQVGAIPAEEMPSE